MNKSEAIQIICNHLADELVIANLGVISRELYACCDRPQNFYMLGSMGMATSIGLGLAMNTDRRVIVLEGDGSLMMNLNTLVTLSNYRPDNLQIIILNDSSYASTGGQRRQRLHLANTIRAFGIWSAVVKNEQELEYALNHRIAVVDVVCRSDDQIPVHVPLSPSEIKERFYEEATKMA